MSIASTVQPTGQGADAAAGGGGDSAPQPGQPPTQQPGQPGQAKSSKLALGNRACPHV